VLNVLPSVINFCEVSYEIRGGKIDALRHDVTTNTEIK